jgi:hypothetical protein
VEVSPLTVLVQGLLAWIFPIGSFPKLFRESAPHQRDQKLTISAITWLMLEVVTGARRSVHAAHKADRMSPAPRLGASYQALYQKYGRLEPEYSAAVVRASAQRCVMLLAAATATMPELFGWEGYRVRILDWRSAYVGELVRSGASVKTCQTLARHSTPSLTIGVYADASLHDIVGAVDSLPDLTTVGPRCENVGPAATGTDPAGNAHMSGPKWASDGHQARDK